ncbi:hypothetical protein K2X85_18350 [bacterium]|nr:hypothetical protein [bacterium]
MADLPSSLRAAIEKFDAAWHSGKVPNLARSLPKILSSHSALADAETRREFVSQLIAIDLEYRWRKANDGSAKGIEAWSLDDYVARIPGLSSANFLTVDLIAEEYRVRSAWGDHP